MRITDTLQYLHGMYIYTGSTVGTEYYRIDYDAALGIAAGNPLDEIKQFFKLSDWTYLIDQDYKLSLTEKKQAILAMETAIDLYSEGHVIASFMSKPVHRLKILPIYFAPVSSGKKRFEIRINDRDYKVGDFLLLQEFDDNKLTCNEIITEITCMSDFQQAKNHVVLGIDEPFCVTKHSS